MESIGIISITFDDTHYNWYLLLTYYLIRNFTTIKNKFIIYYFLNFLLIIKKNFLFILFLLILQKILFDNFKFHVKKSTYLQIGNRYVKSHKNGEIVN